MDILDYAFIYLLVGAISMAIFDVMHYLTKSVVDAETYEANSFSTTDRVQIIIIWPIIWINLIMVAFGHKSYEQSDSDEETND